MTERWRQPVIPISIEKDTRRVITQTIGGVSVPQLVEEVELVLKDEDVKRIAMGYVCINCFEPFEHPMPMKCDVCGFPVRKEQPTRFLRDYNGTEDPIMPLLDKVALMDEHEAREKYKKSDSKIVVP